MARKIEVQIVGDASSLHRALGQVSTRTSRLGRVLGTSFRVASVAATAGLVGLGFAAKDLFSDFEDGQKATEQTKAVIKSTGGAANVTTKHVQNLATTIQGYSGIQDDTVQSGENMLLTFKNIRNETGKTNDIFDQSTKVLADMSTALGQDMPKSAIQLGKALNDPIKGITALRRVGVSFTDKQQNLIDSLVKSGHTMEAQKIILKELRSEFGGSARAAGHTLGGQLNILRGAFENAGSEIIGTFMPILMRLVQTALPLVVKGTKAASKFVGRLFGDLKDLGKSNVAVSIKKGDWTKAGHQIADAIGSGLRFSGKMVDRLVEGLISAVDHHKSEIAAVGLGIGLAMISTLLDTDFWIKNWQPVAIIAANALLLAFAPESKFAQLLKGIPILGGFFRGLEALGGQALKAMAPVARGILKGLEDIFPILTRDGVSIGTNLLGRLRTIPARVGHVFEDMGRFVGRELGNTVKQVGREAARIGGRLVDGLDRFIGIVGNVAQRMATRFLGPIDSLAGRVLGPVRRVGRTIVNAIGGFIGQVFSTGARLGRSIMEGIASGLEGLVGWLQGKISSIASGLLDKAKGILHINSPSKVFADVVGKGIMEGVALGITKNAHLPHGALGDALTPGSFHGSSGAGGGGVIHIHNYLDGREISQSIIRQDKGYRRQNAGRGLFSGSSSG